MLSWLLPRLAVYDIVPQPLSVTPHYSVVAEAPHRISDMYGEGTLKQKGLRFLIVLREPVARTISSWEYKSECESVKGLFRTYRKGSGGRAGDGGGGGRTHWLFALSHLTIDLAPLLRGRGGMGEGGSGKVKGGWRGGKIMYSCHAWP